MANDDFASSSQPTSRLNEWHYIRKAKANLPIVKWVLPAAFFIGLLAPLLASSWYTLRLQAEHVESGLLLEYERMADVLAIGMQEPVWNLLPELGQPLVNTFIADPRVLSVEVRTPEYEDFIVANRNAPSVKPLTFTRDLSFESVPIGQVTLIVESSEIDRILKGQATRVYIAASIQFIISLFIVLVVYVLISRHHDKQELQRLNAKLEEQVAERTLEFQHATEEALIASRAKTEFLSSMSHELRTPMNSVLGFAQLLSDDPIHPLTEKQQKFAEKILRNGELLLTLINHVLDLSKIEAGDVNLDRQKVTLNALVEECVELVQPQVGERKITIHNKIDTSGNPDVWGDKSLVRQILLNLISNAIKYNQDNGSVTLSCEQINVDTLRLTVADTGYGIPAEMEEFLFELFNRLNHQNSVIEGTGIGLVIAKKLAEQMNGAIGYASQSDGGSIFWMELPTVIDA